jgi:outer membrane protein TolC
MMRNYIKIFSLLIAVLWSGRLFSQDTLLISQDEIWHKVNNKNLDIKISQMEIESAGADYKQSKALFLPSVSASHTGFITNNPLMAFGSKLNQEILTPADFDPNVLNNPSRTANFATRVEILQPLINMDGFREREAAKATMEAYQLKSERTKEHLELEVTKAYMQLQLAYEVIGVLQKANSTVQANLELVGNYYNQGMLQKTDLLDVQVRANEVANQIKYAKSNIQNASDYLAYLMGENQGNIVFKPTESLSNEMLTEVYPMTISSNRKDIMAMEKSSEAYFKMVQSRKMSFLPKLNAFGSYELYDPKFFRMRAGGYMVGAQLSWNLFDGYKSIGKLEKAKTDYQKSTIQTENFIAQSQLELNKTQRQLSDTESKVQLTKLAFEQAQESFRIRSNRFEQGLEKTSDILMAEAQVAEKELNYLQAIFEYNFTQHYLKFLTQ